MKTNAPEKLYVDTEDRLSDSILYGFTEKHKDDDIEYVRKDAFIKKAEEFFWERIDGTDYHVNHILKEFENYMKGE